MRGLTELQGCIELRAFGNSKFKSAGLDQSRILGFEGVSLGFRLRVLELRAWGLQFRSLSISGISAR